MNVETIRSYSLSLVGTTEDCAFGEDYVLFRICGKIYACIDLNRPNLVVAKCAPDRAIDLRDRYRGIRGAWHWNKRHWNDIYLDEDVPDAVVIELINHAYQLVRSSLPKKTLYNFPDLPENWEHHHFPEVVSTMDCLADYPEEDSSGKVLLITADSQTKGRGQRGNSWASETGKNLLFSFRFMPDDFPAKSQFLLSQIAALSVVEALKKTIKADLTIKWPNDIYYGDRKICGILIEHALRGSRINTTTIGIGINVNQASFPKNVPNPVSVRQILGREADRAAILRNFIKSFSTGLRQLQKGDGKAIAERYHHLLYRLNQFSPFEDAGGKFEAKICGVDALGHLILRKANGEEKTYAFKEVGYIIG